MFSEVVRSERGGSRGQSDAFAVWGPRAGMQAPLEAGKGSEADSARGLEKEPAPPSA